MNSLSPVPHTIIPRSPLFFSLSLNERALFARRLSLLLESHVTLLEALRILQADASTPSSKFFYTVLVDDISCGQSLATTCKKFERHIGCFAVHIIHVGEKTGALSDSLSLLSDEYHRRKEIRSRVFSALLYPVIVLVATVVISLGLVMFLFPKVVPIFQSFHMPLPLMTRVLMMTSIILHDWGIWIAIAAVITVSALLYGVSRFSAMRKTAQLFLMYTPIAGSLVRLYALSTICRTMGLLLVRNGCIIEALEFTGNSARILVYKVSLLGIAQKVQQGQGVAAELKKSTLFPPIMAQMVHVGETSGHLSETFIHLGNYFDYEIRETTKYISTLAEPVLLLVMGIIVGAIALAIITPMYQITQFLTPFH